jgi:hypothetical protein
MFYEISFPHDSYCETNDSDKRIIAKSPTNTSGLYTYTTQLSAI